MSWVDVYVKVRRLPFAVKRAARSHSGALPMDIRGAARARCDSMPRAVCLPSYGRLGALNEQSRRRNRATDMAGRNGRSQGRTNRSHGKQGWDSRCRRAPSYRWASGYSPWC
ncbi:hypothetical protein Sp245p_21545 (plasmid) [Azospirillum baldaniorum]|uniref:Uncharacterized protein n=1 Tax=Azospirillum baldaniorum TaxID=1064539 RepID=A0A9P1JW52_9PROT|nr:hypothetical protein Sp245p_21545 [Azospirillum baldaniorum]CCD00880.1 protein of unknown function [Azospirillum baldaniorum]